MCEFSDFIHKTKAFAFFGGRNSPRAFPPDILARFPFALRAGCCPKCGRYLQDWERKPPGRATRSMCRKDYENLIARRINLNCFVCGRALQQHKVQAQYQNPREMENHIHDGACNAAWTVIHNVAIAEPEMVVGFDEGYGSPGSEDYAEASPFLNDGDLAGTPALPSPEFQPKALPAPGERQRFQWQRTYKGKVVKVVK